MQKKNHPVQVSPPLHLCRGPLHSQAVALLMTTIDSPKSCLDVKNHHEQHLDKSLDSPRGHVIVSSVRLERPCFQYSRFPPLQGCPRSSVALATEISPVDYTPESGSSKRIQVYSCYSMFVVQGIQMETNIALLSYILLRWAKWL